MNRVWAQIIRIKTIRRDKKLKLSTILKRLLKVRLGLKFSFDELII